MGIGISEEGVANMTVDKVLDATGLSCPMPIVRANKTIDELTSGQVLEVHATDQGATSDISAWSKASGHQLLEHREENGIFKFWIKKK